MKPVRLLSVAVAVMALSSCALKAPSLQVQRIGKGDVGLTGATLEVEFSLRNPNDADVVVERVDYELLMNGRSLGRGYVSDVVRLPAFGERRVRSEFDLSFLRVPGAVREVFDEHRLAARARGHFYMRKAEGNRLQRIGFDSRAETRFDGR